MGPTGHAGGRGRRVALATAADHLGGVGVCPPSPREATPRMAKASRGQGGRGQPPETAGHEKICVSMSVVDDQPTLRCIVWCTLEK